jgi:hypothetical protein
MLKTSTRMLAACVISFLVSTALVACGVITVLRSGGSPSPPVSPPSSPHFASKQSARDAALITVAKYYAATQQIVNEGGVQPDRLDPYVTPRRKAEANERFAALRNSGPQPTGTVRIVRERLLAYTEPSTGRAQVELRLCLESANTGMLDAQQPGLTISDDFEWSVADVALLTSEGGGTTLHVDSEAPREDPFWC